MDEIKQRVSALEERSESHSNRIDRIEVRTDELNKISVLLDVQTEFVKSNQQQLARLGETLQKIDLNLTALTNTVTNLNNRVETLETSVKKMDDYANINWQEIVKKVIGTGIVALLGMAAMYLYSNM